MYPLQACSEVVRGTDTTEALVEEHKGRITKGKKLVKYYKNEGKKGGKTRDGK